MDLQLDGRRALVFGSSAGIGRACAAGLVAEGAAVVVTSRDPERAASVAAEIGATGSVGVDLAVAGAGARAVADAAALLGGLDVVIVNTGGGKPGPIMATDGADDAAYASMLRSALEVARAAAPLITAGAEPGRMVFLTARSIVEASPELALSSVFRSGVHAAARSLAIELAPGATVNVIVTGQFDTGALARFESARAEHEGRTVADVRTEHVASIPVGRIGRAEELADVVTFLCSPRASFVNGAVIRVDGGAVRGF